MTNKMLMLRWFFSAICLTFFALVFAAIVEQGSPVAELMAPEYVPLPAEEVFRLANLECVRPPGAKTGCVYPDEGEPEVTGDVLQDLGNEQLAKAERLGLAIRLNRPEDSNRNRYYENEIRPRHDQLILWAGIVLGIASLLVVARTLVITREWSNTREPLSVDIEWRKFVPETLGAGLRDAAASRKLRRIDSDLKALKSLRDNGVISDEVFEERKNALRDSIS